MTQTFTLKAIVLIVERRECTNCKAHYTSPSRVMLGLQSPGRTIREYCAVPANFLEYDLPRETKTVRTYVEACQECFSLRQQDANQLSLFTNGKAKETYAMQDVEVSTALGKLEVKRLIPSRNIKETVAPRGTGKVGKVYSDKKLPPKVTDFF